MDQENLNNKLLELSTKAFNASESYFSANIRKPLIDNVRQFNSQHFQNSKYESDMYKFRSRLFKPKSRGAIRKHEAAFAATLFQHDDFASVVPINDDDMLQQLGANFYSALMNYRLRKDPTFFKTQQLGYQDAMVNGFSVSKVFFDFEDNKPTISLIAPENFRFDPSANWLDPINKSPYLIEIIPMKIFEIKEKIANEGWIDVDDGILASARKNKYDPIRLAREMNRLDPQDRPNPIEEYDIIYVHLNFVKLKGVDYVFYTAGTDVLLTNPVPINELYIHGRRPYVMGYINLEAHKNYPSGLMQLTRPLQQEANDITNLRIDNVVNALNPKMAIKRNQNVDGMAIRRMIPGSIIQLSDPKNDINVIHPADATNTSYQEMNLLNLDYDSIVGGFDGATVQANRSLNETVGGMNLLSATSNQTTEYQITTYIKTAVTPILELYLELLRHYENDEVIMAIAGQKADVMKHFNSVSEMSYYLSQQNLDMSVQVGMGSTNPINHVEKMMMVMGNMGKIFPDLANRLNFTEVAKEMFAKVGFKDYERLLNNDQEDPEKAMLQQQIQQLQQELQAKKPDFVWKAEADYISAQAMEKRVAAAFGSMQASEILALQPGIGPIADSIMQSAGWNNEQGENPNINLPGNIPAQAQQEVANNPVNIQKNNNPLTPTSPEMGFNSGIEGGKQ